MIAFDTKFMVSN